MILPQYCLVQLLLWGIILICQNLVQKYPSGCLLMVFGELALLWTTWVEILHLGTTSTSKKMEWKSASVLRILNGKWSAIHLLTQFCSPINFLEKNTAVIWIHIMLHLFEQTLFSRSIILIREKHGSVIMLSFSLAILPSPFIMKNKVRQCYRSYYLHLK